MDMWIWTTVAILAVVAAAVIAWGVISFRQRRHSQELRREFSSEYDWIVGREGRAKGEAELARRRDRVRQLNVRPLGQDQRERYERLWVDVQARFVDEPGGAVADADHLVGEVMLARGYPVTNFEQRAADVSVGHPQVVPNYRAAHAVAVRHGRGEASTEELRQAMVHYRSLFAALLADEPRTESTGMRPAPSH